MILENVPFDEQGNMRHDTSWGVAERRPLAPFEGTLEYDGYTRGRSAMTIYWRGVNGLRYPMFWSDFDRLIKHRNIIFGNVYGIWRGVKRSGYYGIQYVPESEISL
ncbi:hypothetical protein ACIBCT_35505 [Streptosporangium sp. NPDC050855]|uniref:hypothetical protein n=1 Tax=Streptosporangium sp. NPDC050855 TaxID=3366194 RepID=UPI0037A65DE9